MEDEKVKTDAGAGRGSVVGGTEKSGADSNLTGIVHTIDEQKSAA